MESTEHLARVIKEAKAQFERECANLPRLEIDRLWQRQLSELVTSKTGVVIKKDRSFPKSEPCSINGSKPWKKLSPIRAASKVVDEASTEPLSLYGVPLPLVGGPVLSPQTGTTRSHASQQIPEESLVEGSRKRRRRRSIDTVSTYELLPPPYALSDV